MSQVLKKTSSATPASPISASIGNLGSLGKGGDIGDSVKKLVSSVMPPALTEMIASIQKTFSPAKKEEPAAAAPPAEGLLATVSRRRRAPTTNARGATVTGAPAGDQADGSAVVSPTKRRKRETVLGAGF